MAPTAVLSLFVVGICWFAWSWWQDAHRFPLPLASEESVMHLGIAAAWKVERYGNRVTGIRCARHYDNCCVVFPYAWAMNDREMDNRARRNSPGDMNRTTR